MKLERLSQFYKQVQEIYGKSLLAFEAGFIYGLAEKVYVGACPAAMVKVFPPNDGRLTDGTEKVAERIAQIFGLDYYLVVRPLYYEAWIFKYGYHKQLLVDNLNDNVIRGMLCGYNPEGIDPNFRITK